jgi:TonB family protein
MTEGVRSTLIPERQPLAFPVVLALFLHVLVAASIACVGMFTPDPKPILDVENIEVSMVVLPRSKGLPDRATRAPPPPVGESTPTPAEPPLPRESDLVVHRPEAKATAGTQNTARDRDRLMRELTMQQLLQDVEAPVGEVDRQPTDPNSESDEAINAGQAGLIGDPELARYIAQIEALFMQHFKPLPTIVAANPGIKCSIRVQVDPDTGDVTGYEVVGASGNSSYDGAAERAVQAVARIPQPPEKYKSVAAAGYTIHFAPP